MSKADRVGSGDRRRGRGTSAGVLVRLSLFAAALAVVFVAALGVGAAVGPLDDTPDGTVTVPTTAEPTNGSDHAGVPRSAVDTTTTTTTTDASMHAGTHGGGS